jgi:MFS family permease
VLADRFPKRRLLTVTQLTMALPAPGLFAVTATGVVEPWMVFALVFARGSVNAIDHPARQSFVIEMVGQDRVVNAVGLNSVLIHSARIVGPALGGLLILVWGVEPCFLVNALSFGAMVVALRGMDPAELHAAPPAVRERGAVRAALAYVRRTPSLAIPLAMMAVVGTLGFNFQVILPLLARFTFEGGPGAYTALAVAMGIGSVAGALATGTRSRIGPRLLVGAALAFGTLALVAAAAPTLALEVAILVPLGAATVTFAAGINSALQLAARPEMRGRVMALYSIVFLGTTPIGGPLVGWLAEVAGPRAGLLLSGTAALVAAAGAWIAFARNHAARESLAKHQGGAPPGTASAADAPADHLARDRDARLRRVRGEGRARGDRARPGRPTAVGLRHRRDVEGHPAPEGDEAVPRQRDDSLARERAP